jgi:hypothetical protein
MPSENMRGIFLAASLAFRENSSYSRPQIGRLAQLVERFVYTEDVGSSSLSSPTITRCSGPGSRVNLEFALGYGCRCCAPPTHREIDSLLMFGLAKLEFEIDTKCE